jgi:hypothetical protein
MSDGDKARSCGARQEPNADRRGHLGGSSVRPATTLLDRPAGAPEARHTPAGDRCPARLSGSPMVPVALALAATNEREFVIEDVRASPPGASATPRSNASVWIEHTVQRSDLNRQSCPNASARTYSGIRFGPEIRRPRQPARPLAPPPCPPRAQPTEAPSHSPPPAAPLCFPAARAPPPFRCRCRHIHRRRPLAAPDRQKEIPPSTAPRRRPRPPLATLRRSQLGGLRELPSQAARNLFGHLPT